MQIYEFGEAPRVPSAKNPAVHPLNPCCLVGLNPHFFLGELPFFWANWTSLLVKTKVVLLPGSKSLEFRCVVPGELPTFVRIFPSFQSWIRFKIRLKKS